MIHVKVAPIYFLDLTKLKEIYPYSKISFRDVMTNRNVSGKNVLNVGSFLRKLILHSLFISVLFQS